MPDSNPVGRPSKYSPAYCNEVIACMGQGFSLTAFAGSIGVSRDSVYEWAKEHREFSDALSKAKAKRSMYWEGRLMEGGSITGAAIFALKNVDPGEWRDKHEIEQNVNVVVTDAREQIISRLAGIASRTGAGQGNPRSH